MASVAFLLTHATWGHARGVRTARTLARGRELVTAALGDTTWPESVVAMIGSLPSGVQLRLFVELGTTMAGTHRARLLALARQVGAIDRAERRCGSRLWWRRLQGVRLLTLLGGGDTVVPALFSDPVVEVRAQAAEWAVDHPAPEVVDALLAMLGDDKTLCRYTVQDSLLRLGLTASGPLCASLAHMPAASLPAALKVAAGIADSRFLDPALSLARHPRPEVRAGAAALLGAVGGDRAAAVVTSLLADGTAEVRAAAAGAVGKLGHWAAASSLSELMRDPAWDVRSQAALALRTLGAPGLLFLRRMLGDHDRFARDMAKQVLELPTPAAVT